MHKVHQGSGLLPFPKWKKSEIIIPGMKPLIHFYLLGRYLQSCKILFAYRTYMSYYPMHFFNSYSVSFCVCLFVCRFFAEMHVGHHVGVKVIIGHPSCFGGCCVTRVTVWNSHGHGTPSGTPSFRQRAGKAQRFTERIKPNRLGYMKGCSRRLVLEIILT